MYSNMLSLGILLEVMAHSIPDPWLPDRVKGDVSHTCATFRIKLISFIFSSLPRSQVSSSSAHWLMFFLTHLNQIIKLITGLKPFCMLRRRSNHLIQVCWATVTCLKTTGLISPQGLKFDTPLTPGCCFADSWHQMQDNMAKQMGPWVTSYLNKQTGSHSYEVKLPRPSNCFQFYRMCLR